MEWYSDAGQVGWCPEPESNGHAEGARLSDECVYRFRHRGSVAGLARRRCEVFARAREEIFDVLRLHFNDPIDSVFFAIVPLSMAG
jgi:hypothetical protein